MLGSTVWPPALARVADDLNVAKEVLCRLGGLGLGG